MCVRHRVLEVGVNPESSLAVLRQYLNGDETHQWRHMQIGVIILHVQLYDYK